MNIIIRKLIEWRAQKMLTKLADRIKGYKTYILATVGIMVALAGHFWGPIQIGDMTIPHLSWNEVWKIVWDGGLFAALRLGVAKGK